jgi:hypothetical protein
MALAPRTYEPGVIEDIFQRLQYLERGLADSKRKTPSTIERLNPITFPVPVEGQVAIDSRTNCLIHYANGKWREGCGGKFEILVTDPLGAAIKVVNGLAVMMIPKDLDGTVLVHAAAGLDTVGSGTTTIQYVNKTQALTMLSTPVTIPGGSHTSYTSSTVSTGTINPANSQVATGDLIAVNVTTIGADGKGLIAILHFGFG